MNYGPFQHIVENRAKAVRPGLYDESRAFQWPVACLRVCLPGIAALLFFFALSPQEWNVSDAWVKTLNNLKFISLIGVAVFGAYAALMAVAVFDVHQTGWKAPPPLPLDPLDDATHE